MLIVALAARKEIGRPTSDRFYVQPPTPTCGMAVKGEGWALRRSQRKGQGLQIRTIGGWEVILGI
jgi:hypothetical protein